MTVPNAEPDHVHRLKNYLAIIVGFSELLLEDFAEDDPRRSDLLEVVAAARAAVAMMPDITRLMR